MRVLEVAVVEVGQARLLADAAPPRDAGAEQEHVGRRAVVGAVARRWPAPGGRTRSRPPRRPCGPRSVLRHPVHERRHGGVELAEQASPGLPSRRRGVSKPPSDTEKTRVATPASTHCATRSSWAASAAAPPPVRGRRRGLVVVRVRVGVRGLPDLRDHLVDRAIRSAKQAAARACSARLAGRRPRRGRRRPAGQPRGVLAAGQRHRGAGAASRRPAAAAAPARTRPPAAGRRPRASSQRPSQPVVPGRSGWAVCQMSIDRKWLRSGFG